MNLKAAGMPGCQIFAIKDVSERGLWLVDLRLGGHESFFLLHDNARMSRLAE